MLNETCVSLLAHADDTMLLNEDKRTLVELYNRLINTAKKVRPHINPEKTEYNLRASKE